MIPSNSQALNAPWMSAIPDPANWQSWLQMFQPPGEGATAKDGESFVEPETVAHLQEEYMQELTSLWQDLLAAKTPPLEDKRFIAPEWRSNTLHAFNAAMYLLNARFLMEMTEAVKTSPKVKQKIRFAVQQVIDAMSPANFLVTNPEAQQKLVETKGDSLARGVTHMLSDLKKGRISQTDESAFEVGRNVATTEGAVVFENDLFQLIQYKPLTETVHERPLLIVPPCINKYYIMDLQPSNSLVRHAVEQGHTVFLVSWANPDASLGHLTWDDFVEQAIIKAIHAAQEISGSDQINALGFCVGGTLLSTALAVLFARGEKPVASLTLLTVLLDYADTGIMDVFIDELQVKLREQTIGQGGLMLGRDFATAFSSLRPNDLIWNYVKSSYLKGEDPPPFDLLYWNADSTNLPGPMFCWYLRNTYLEDNLKVPKKLVVAGEKIDLGKINAPVFIYGSREDHIVPWQSAFASMRLLNPKKRSRNKFVLGASGHIAGVINPPAKKKRNYWVGDASADNAEEWFDSAIEHPGSWWTEWDAFLSTHAGKQIKAPRKLGSTSFKPIEPAPGRYVKVKSE